MAKTHKNNDFFTEFFSTVPTECIPEFYFPPDELFSIENKVSLLEGKVSAGLYNEFQKRNYPLKKNKAKILRIGHNWFITDQINHYTMKKTPKGLLEVHWEKDACHKKSSEGLYKKIVANFRKKSHSWHPLVYQNNTGKFLGEWWKTIVYVSVFYLAFTTILVEGYQIPSGSMEPTFHGEMSWKGDRIFAMKNLFRLWPLKRGEIVIFISVEDHTTFIVKRLVALPGERVEIKKGKVYINGKKLTAKPFDNIVYASDIFDEIIYLPHKIHPGSLQFFLRQLSNPANPISLYLLQRFSNSLSKKIFTIQPKLEEYIDTYEQKRRLKEYVTSLFALKRTILEAFRGESVQVKKLREVTALAEEQKPEIVKFTKRLGKELQKIFAGKLIYKKSLFRHVTLSLRTKQLLQEKKVKTSELNQILLRNVYCNHQYTYGILGNSFVVPKDRYFVLGDNTTNSKDSRVWGLVPKRKLLGKALLIWFPWYRLKILGFDSGQK